MKKVIRLTESELNNIIRKVILETENNDLGKRLLDKLLSKFPKVASAYESAKSQKSLEPLLALVPAGQRDKVIKGAESLAKNPEKIEAQIDKLTVSESWGLIALVVLLLIGIIFFRNPDRMATNIPQHMRELGIW